MCVFQLRGLDQKYFEKVKSAINGYAKLKELAKLIYNGKPSELMGGGKIQKFVEEHHLADRDTVPLFKIVDEQGVSLSSTNYSTIYFFNLIIYDVLPYSIP